MEQIERELGIKILTIDDDEAIRKAISAEVESGEEKFTAFLIGLPKQN